MRALLDTNILIDHLRSVNAARLEIERYELPAISVVTWMEVMAGAARHVEAETRRFLDAFALLPIDGAVAERAARIRRETRMRLPDAIIRATAAAHDMLLVTRNTRDFGRDDPGVRIPYHV
jgi:predicted nucleic acid-binding protein